MPWHVGANGIGLAIAAVWLGWAGSVGHVGWAAIAAMPLFLAGLLHPFLAEHRALSRSFRRIDEETRARHRRARGEGPRQEVFGGSGSEPPPMFRRRADPHLPAMVLLVIGTVLLIGDGAWFAVEAAGLSERGQDGIIANF